MEKRWRPMQPSDYPYSMHVKKGVQRRQCLHQGHAMLQMASGI